MNNPKLWHCGMDYTYNLYYSTDITLRDLVALVAFMDIKREYFTPEEAAEKAFERADEFLKARQPGREE